MKKDEVFEFFRRLAEANPAPATELEYTNPYTLLVAVVLSAQATDASVNIACRPLFKRISKPQQMVDLGEEQLLQRGVFVMPLMRERERPMKRLFQAAGECRHSVFQSRCVETFCERLCRSVPHPEAYFFSITHCKGC